jgi:hypothetical protein
MMNILCLRKTPGTATSRQFERLLSLSLVTEVRNEHHKHRTIRRTGRKQFMPLRLSQEAHGH